MNHIDDLIEMIQRLHGCAAYHVETVPVKEVFQGQTVWQGEVEVFNIRGHPQARRCYAWAHATGEDDKGKRYVAVLELPPVDSAQTAVRAAIIQEAKDAKQKGK
jgi:hypothetical protein